MAVGVGLERGVAVRLAVGEGRGVGEEVCAASLTRDVVSVAVDCSSCLAVAVGGGVVGVGDAVEVSSMTMSGRSASGAAVLGFSAMLLLSPPNALRPPGAK